MPEGKFWCASAASGPVRYPGCSCAYGHVEHCFLFFGRMKLVYVYLHSFVAIVEILQARKQAFHLLYRLHIPNRDLASPSRYTIFPTLIAISTYLDSYRYITKHGKSKCIALCLWLLSIHRLYSISLLKMCVWRFYSDYERSE